MFGFRQCVLIYFSSLMNSNTLLKPNTSLRIFSRLQIDLSILYTDSIYLILSKIQLRISQRIKLCFSLFFPQKRQNLFAINKS